LLLWQAIGSVFQANKAGWGGAIEIKSSIFNCEDSEMIENEATWDGGAVNTKNSSLDMTRCFAEGNEAKNNAGGMWLESSVMVATGCRFESNVAKDHDGGAIFALESGTKFRGCHFDKNKGKKGMNVYNHGGLLEGYCTYMKGLYNKPKVGGQIVQDCFVCPAGSYGDFYSAGTDLCQEECAVTGSSMDCYECPYELACEGEKQCKPGYEGNQCMECSSGNCKLGEQCVPSETIYAVVGWAFLVTLFYIIFLAVGPVLDVHHFTRAKLYGSMIQLLILIGKVHNAFGPSTAVTVAIFQPLGFWIDFQTIQCFAGEALGYLPIHLLNLIVPLVILIILHQVSEMHYRQRLATGSIANLKSERRWAQLTLLMAELSYIPLLWNAASSFYCTENADGKFMVAAPELACSGVEVYVTRAFSIFIFVVVGAALPLLLRYIIIKLYQQEKIYAPDTRELYRALYESYEYNRVSQEKKYYAYDGIAACSLSFVFCACLLGVSNEGGLTMNHPVWCLVMYGFFDRSYLI